MDFGTAVVTLAVGAIAVLPRVPALTAAGRAQAGIQRDSELWVSMPPGTVRDALGAEIEKRTHELVKDRGRDKTVETGWLYGTAWTALAWLLLVASTAVTGDAAWADSVRTALLIVGLALGAVGVSILALTGVLGAWKASLRVFGWLRGRRGATGLTYEI